MLKRIFSKFWFFQSERTIMQLRSIVKENNLIIRNIYQEHYKNKRKPTGLVLAELEINTDGKVQSIQFTKNDLDKSFELKLEKTILNWYFYNIELTKTIKLEIPFYFSSSNTN